MFLKWNVDDRFKDVQESIQGLKPKVSLNDIEKKTKENLTIFIVLIKWLPVWF